MRSIVHRPSAIASAIPHAKNHLVDGHEIHGLSMKNRTPAKSGERRALESQRAPPRALAQVRHPRHTNYLRIPDPATARNLTLGFFAWEAFFWLGTVAMMIAKSAIRNLTCPSVQFPVAPALPASP